jgi:hypothetical protein
MANNGSAFPVFDSTRVGMDYGCTDEGMDLRDWFAGQSLSEAIKAAWEYHDGCDVESEDWYKTAARIAYAMSDAMIAAREVKNA